MLAAAHVEAVRSLRSVVMGPPESQLRLGAMATAPASAGARILDELERLGRAWESEADRLASMVNEANDARCRVCGLELECPSCGY